MTTRRQQAAAHVRDRAREVAGELATVSRAGTALAEGVTVVKVAADKLVQTVGGDFTIESDEHAWLIGRDDIDEALEVGDLLTVDSTKYRVVEGVATQRHWQWWGVDRLQRVYVTKVWES